MRLTRHVQDDFSAVGQFGLAMLMLVVAPIVCVAGDVACWLRIKRDNK